MGSINTINAIGGERQVRNPWLGLVTYTEELVAYGYKFCGREVEIGDMLSLIEGNMLTTLYGRSGIGKSSLLEAGIFPKLRNRGYTPFWIRLGSKLGDKRSFTEQVIDVIGESPVDIIDVAKEDKSDALSVDDMLKVMETLSLTEANKDAIASKIRESRSAETQKSQNDWMAEKYLWDFFLTHRFEKKDGMPTIPVLVFDQFEEVLLKRKDETLLLLRQIYALMNNCASQPEGSEVEGRVRIVFSIREDFLYLLEEAIDLNGFALMKNNRYRLQPLSDRQAIAIITEAGRHDPRDTYAPPDAVDEKFADKIAEAIINHVRESSGDGTISTQIISLVCHQLFEKLLAEGQRPVLTLPFVSDKKNMSASLADFYLEKTKSLSEKERRYIEDTLVDNGVRKSVSLSDYKRALGDNWEYLLKDNLVHTYKVSSNAEEQVEIIHDQIAKVIEDEKEKAQLLATKKRQRRWIVASMVAILLVVLVSLFSSRMKKPIVYNYKKYVGKTLTWQGRPYEIPNGNLVLEDCAVSLYALSDAYFDTLTIRRNVKINDEIDPRTLVLDGGIINSSFPFSFDSLETIIIKAPSTLKRMCRLWRKVIYVPNLKDVFISDPNFRYADGTVFEKEGDTAWLPVISRRKQVYYDSSHWTIRNATPYTIVDIAKIFGLKEIGYYVLTCSDTTKKILNLKDIPSNGIMVGVDLPWIEEIGDSCFYKKDNIQFAYLPKTRKIGKANFCSSSYSDDLQLDTVCLPDTVVLLKNNNYNYSELTQFSNCNLRRSGFSGDVVFVCGDDKYRWSEAEHGLVKEGKSKDPQTTVSNKIRHPNNGGEGYGYDQHGKIVFLSESVTIPKDEEHELAYITETSIIPKKIKVEQGNKVYRVSDNKLYVRCNKTTEYFGTYGTEVAILALANGKRTRLERGEAWIPLVNGEYEVFWPEPYHFPEDATIYVPYGQKEFFRRVYSNRVIREMGLVRTLVLKTKIKTFSVAEHIRGGVNIGVTYDSITQTLLIKGEGVASYCDEEYFDRPEVRKCKISIKSGFHIKGNVLYDGLKPIRCITNDKPIVLPDGFNTLNGKKIHAGVYILLTADAMPSEPLLEDRTESYTFFVPHGMKRHFTVLERAGARVEEMSRMRTMWYNIPTEWLDETHHNKLVNQSWNWRYDGIPVVMFCVLSLVLILLANIWSKTKHLAEEMRSWKQRTLRGTIYLVDVVICVGCFGMWFFLQSTSTLYPAAIYALPSVTVLLIVLHGAIRLLTKRLQDSRGTMSQKKMMLNT